MWSTCLPKRARSPAARPLDPTVDDLDFSRNRPRSPSPPLRDQGRRATIGDMETRASAEEPIGLPAADAEDPVIEAYKKDVDRTLLRENLKLTPEERSQQLVSFLAGIVELRRAEERLRRRDG